MSDQFNQENSWWSGEKSRSEVGKYFDPKDVSLDIRHVSIDYLLAKLYHEEIDLLPRFQRRYDLWSIELKSQLIESILLNFPIPPLYFDSSSLGKWVVIDGLQRLWTLKGFVLDNNFKLKGLSVLVHLNGSSFSELERQYQRRINEYPTIAYLIRPGAPRFVIYDIFRRLNTGGVALNAQEIRHALNPFASDFLEALSRDPFVKKNVRLSNRRMENDELILRITAFSLINFNEYQPPMSLFLDKTMEYLNHAEQEQMNMLGYRIHRSMIFLDEVLGKNIFLRSSLSSKQRFNKALFEAWCVAIARLEDDHLANIATKRQELFDRYELLLEDPEFIDSITVSTASKKSVVIRFQNITKLLLELI